MFYVRKDASKAYAFGKGFYRDGSILEGDFDRKGRLINGFKWVLREDKTHKTSTKWLLSNYAQLFAMQRW